MQWQYTPYTSLLVLTAIVALTIAAIIWQRRKAAGAIPFVVLMVALAQWSTGYALELAATDLAAKIIFAKIQYLGIVTVIASWFVFTLQFTRRDKWLTRRNVVLLAIEPLIMVALVWTNELHGQIWTSVSLNSSTGFTVLDTTHGLLFWVHTAYSYILFLLGSYWLFQDLLRSTTIYRARVTALLVGAAAPWLANVLTISQLSPFTGLDLTPFAFTLTGLMTAWALFRYQWLDLAPVARDIVIESMSDALLVLDAQGRVVDLNPAACEITRHTLKEAIGRPILELVPTSANLIEHYRNVMETHAEITIGDGPTARPYDLRISPVHDRQHSLAGRVIVLSDITERKRAEEALKNANHVLEERGRQLEAANARAEEANRLKSQFLSTMSHELRTPFNAIMGFTDLLLTERIGPLNPTQRNFLERTAGNNKRLLALVNDILDLSRIEAGRMEIVNAPYPVRDMLEHVAAQTSSLFSQKGLDFSLTIDPSMPNTVIGDRDRVQQIVVNLLSNASKFTTQGMVELKASAKDSANWQIAVRDTGPGIAPHQLELIFEPFRQVDGTSTREFAGTGLGLSIVRDLCRLMNGSVSVASDLGMGSTFTVNLPTRAAEHRPDQSTDLYPVAAPLQAVIG